MGGAWCSKGHGFESQHHILYGHFSHIGICCKNCLFEKTKIKEKRRGWPIKKLNKNFKRVVPKQCVQIARFLKVPGNKVSYKMSQKYFEYYWAWCSKTSHFKVKTAASTFGLLFIIKSGHIGHNFCEIFYSSSSQFTQIIYQDTQMIQKWYNKVVFETLFLSIPIYYYMFKWSLFGDIRSVSCHILFHLRNVFHNFLMCRSTAPSWPSTRPWGGTMRSTTTTPESFASSNTSPPCSSCRCQHGLEIQHTTASSTGTKLGNEFFSRIL